MIPWGWRAQSDAFQTRETASASLFMENGMAIRRSRTPSNNTANSQFLLEVRRKGNICIADLASATYTNLRLSLDELHHQGIQHGTQPPWALRWRQFNDL